MLMQADPLFHNSGLNPEHRRSASWQAELELGYCFKNSKTVLAHRRSFGPLTVQRPFYPEGDVCHTYILHPPGGFVGGDKLTISVDIEKDAHALITTPGAGKFYRSDSYKSEQMNKLTVKGGTLEWFPQESIIFNGATAKTVTQVDLYDDGCFIGWEVLCLGRPASHERFEEGQIQFSLLINQNNSPLLIENLMLGGNDPLLSAEWGLRSFNCVATFIASPVDKTIVEKVKENMSDDERCLVGITQIDNVLVCRLLTEQAEYAKQYFIQLWSLIRKDMTGQSICEPRIWKT